LSANDTTQGAVEKSMILSQALILCSDRAIILHGLQALNGKVHENARGNHKHGKDVEASGGVEREQVDQTVEASAEKSREKG
jgi:hypothetical protein